MGTKRTKHIATTFHRQYKHLMQMVKVGMRRCPSGLWSKDVPGRDWTVGEMVWHAISSLSNPTLLGPQALPNKLRTAENEVTQDAVLAAMEQINRFIQDVVLQMSDQALLANGRDDQAGICVKHLMYALRHTQHHVGEFVQILAENGTKPPAWPTANRQ